MRITHHALVPYTPQWLSTMISTSLGGTMVRIAEMTSSNLTLRLISGPKFSQLTIHRLQRETGTPLWLINARFISLEVMMVSTGLMTSTDTISRQESGRFRRSLIQKQGLVLATHIVLWFTIISSIFLVAMTATIGTTCTDLTFSWLSGSKFAEMGSGLRVATELQLRSWGNACTSLAVMTVLANSTTSSTSTLFRSSGPWSIFLECLSHHRVTPMCCWPTETRFICSVGALAILAPTFINSKLTRTCGSPFRASSNRLIKRQAPASAMLAKFWKTICTFLEDTMVYSA